jgi:hypothetical protein
MMLKARGLDQHSGPPGWQEESDPAGCDFESDRRSILPALSYRTVNVDSTQPSVMTSVTNGRQGPALHGYTTLWTGQWRYIIYREHTRYISEWSARLIVVLSLHL